MTGAVGRAGRWTGPGVSCAAGLARCRLVEAGSTLVRVGASVLPRLPLKLPRNPQRARLRAVAVPAHPDGLALSRPDGQREHETHAVAASQCGLDQPLDVLDLERLDLLILYMRRLRERDRVADDVPATQRLGERCARCAVHLVRGRRTCTTRDHPCVEPLEVLRRNLVDPMLPHARRQVLVYRGAVRPVRLVLDRRPGDVLHPVRQPGLHGRRAAGLTDCAALALPFELADCRDDLGLGPALDVAPVRRAVVLDAHGDSAMPLAVPAEVNARRTVGCAGPVGPLAGHLRPPFRGRSTAQRATGRRALAACRPGRDVGGPPARMRRRLP